ncbi:MAG: monooxygenase, partial [Sphingomonadales bacterium]
PAAQAAWVDLLLSGPGMMMGNSECTPGYYNNEGQPMDERAKYAVGHPGGAMAWFRHIDAWRRAGDFKGLHFR